MTLNTEINNLKRLLEKHQIPYQNWGSAATKTLESLFEEIKNGNSQLIKTGNKLARHVKAVRIRVYSPDGKKQLLEEKQVFKNGSVRERNLPYGINEKMNAGERPLHSAVRALKEELNLTVAPSRFRKIKGIEKIINESLSYPGLLAVRIFYSYELTLSKSEFKLNYIDEQDDKTTYFVWR